MTAITRPVVRRTACFLKSDEIVIELQRGVLVARLKGKPSSRHTIGYQDLYETLRWKAARIAATERIKEKAQERRAGRRK